MAMAAAVIVTAAAGPAAAGSGCVGRMGKSVEASIPGHAFKKVFYENDFRYLDDPCLALIDTPDGFSRLTDRAKRLRPMPRLASMFGFTPRASMPPAPLKTGPPTPRRKTAGMWPTCLPRPRRRPARSRPP